MGDYAAGTRLSDLRLVDAPVSEESAAATDEAPRPPVVVPTPSVSQDSLDRFLAEAALEFETGHIEQPLWVQAVEKAAGDEAEAKTAYLKARATALKLERRDRRVERATRRARASSDEKGQSADPGSVPGVSRTVASSATRGAPTRRRVALVGVTIASITIAATLLALRPWEASPGQPDAGHAAARAVAPSSPGSPRSPVASTARPAGSEPSTIDFAAKVRELRAAENWNVLVLYAAEWTRKQPTDPEAWKELGRGYHRLHQYRDARDALGKATKLGPADFQAWQDLGQANVELDDAEAALAAFGRAVDLNERDVTSLASIGTLQQQLGHLPEAKAAFAAALAVSPGDTEALCGAEGVARKEGRSKDADALRRQIDADGRACRADAGANAVAVAPAAKKMPARYR